SAVLAAVSCSVGLLVAAPALGQAAAGAVARSAPASPATEPGGEAADKVADKAARELGWSIYRELVEIDTTQSSGDTLRASQAMAQRLRGAGFAWADVRVFATAPKRGNLVARLR